MVMSELVTLAINAVLALVSVGAWILNRRESKARVENLDALTKKVEAERKKLEVDRKQASEDLADKATEKNNELFDRLQKEREDNERIRKEERAENERIRKEERAEYESALKRISKNLVDFQTNLQNKESREVLLLNDIDRYKQMKIKDDVRMGELEQKLAAVEKKHDIAIEEIVRKTAPLPERDELKQK